MLVEVEVPDEYLGNVIGDLISKRGKIEGQEAHARFQRVKALVPLSRMFGYATALSGAARVPLSAPGTFA